MSTTLRNTATVVKSGSIDHPSCNTAHAAHERPPPNQVRRDTHRRTTRQGSSRPRWPTRWGWMEPPRRAWPWPACRRTLIAEESAMRTILIAHKDLDVATELAAEFRQSGFRVIECPGPLPPKERCIRCDKGYCPLTEGADLMVYDPQLTAVD